LKSTLIILNLAEGFLLMVPDPPIF